MEPEAPAPSGSSFAPLPLFVARRRRSSTASVGGVGRAASGRDASGVACGVNGATSPIAMRTKRRDQSSAANNGWRENEVAARCADLRPTLTARLEHETVSDGICDKSSSGTANAFSRQVVYLRSVATPGWQQHKGLQLHGETKTACMVGLVPTRAANRSVADCRCTMSSSEQKPGSSQVLISTPCERITVCLHVCDI